MTTAMKVTGRGISVNDTLRKHAEESMEGALKVFDISPMSAEMVLRHESKRSTKSRATCEVTVKVPKSTIRVSESAERIEPAIDAAASRVSRQLRKYKTKLVDRHKRDRGATARAGLAKMSIDELNDIRDKAKGDGDDGRLVREKHIETLAMSVDEAMIQCDLLGHDFYLFRDLNTDELRVVYRRQDGGYGLLVADAKEEGLEEPA